MPTFRPRHRGISYSEALAEAYASAPEDEVILDTLEFRHSSFVVNGVQVAPRIVNDHVILSARLEGTAPLNAGEIVEFQPVGFRFARQPENNGSRPPELALTVDNVSRILIPYLDLAKETRDPITVTWRPYCLTDLSGPHMDPPLTLTVYAAVADMMSVSITAGFPDLANRRFPAKEYTSSRFPGLVAR